MGLFPVLRSFIGGFWRSFPAQLSFDFANGVVDGRLSLL
jgi:hypothetical protein